MATLVDVGDVVRFELAGREVRGNVVEVRPQLVKVMVRGMAVWVSKQAVHIASGGAR